MTSRIIRPYKITYHCGTTQVKNLILHRDFKEIIQPKQKEIYDLECSQENKEANKKTAQQIKRELFEMFGEFYFTNQSPLYDAIFSHALKMPEHCGGTKPCSVVVV